LKPEKETAPPAFTLVMPKHLSAGILFTSPHSGRFVPNEIRANTNLDDFALRTYEDSYVDKIIETIPQHGLPTIAGNYSRVFIDLNRDPNILDSKVVAEVTTPGECEYTSAGHGLIARHISQGKEIYVSKLSLEAAKARIELVHKPYHNEIAKQLKSMKSRYGQAWLFDIHSMPNSSLRGEHVDIVLGDRFGSSCMADITICAKQHFEKFGFKVMVNRPFAGGFSTRIYGKPMERLHALQIEVNRKLYMNEHSLVINNGFATIQSIFHEFAATMRDHYFCQNDLAIL